MSTIAELTDKHERELVIVDEISDEMLERLMENTNRDPLIHRETPDDARRFGTHESLRDWLAVERDIYTLEHGSELAGIIWFRPGAWDLQGPSPSHTFAIRMYRPYRGAGSAHQFADTATRDVIRKTPEMKGIWLTTDKDNEAAHRLYKRLGYVMAGRTKSTSRDVMRLGEPYFNSSNQPIV